MCQLHGAIEEMLYKLCGLGLRVWLLGAAVACHSDCFLSVVTHRNVGQQCLSFGG